MKKSKVKSVASAGVKSDDRGLFFMIISLGCLWLILDEFVGNKILSNLITNILGLNNVENGSEGYGAGAGIDPNEQTKLEIEDGKGAGVGGNPTTKLDNKNNKGKGAGVGGNPTTKLDNENNKGKGAGVGGLSTAQKNQNASASDGFGGSGDSHSNSIYKNINPNEKRGKSH